VLAQEGAEVRARDFFKNRLGVEELRELLGGRSPAELFSWKSVLARQRGYQPGMLSDDEMLRLMAEEPTLIRRPFVRAGTRLVVGADAGALRDLATGP
jgi:arsenate reductase-like glutaredoxin family protein